MLLIIEDERKKFINEWNAKGKMWKIYFNEELNSFCNEHPDYDYGSALTKCIPANQSFEYYLYAKQENLKEIQELNNCLCLAYMDGFHRGRKRTEIKPTSIKERVATQEEGECVVFLEDGSHAIAWASYSPTLDGTPPKFEHWTFQLDDEWGEITHFLPLKQFNIPKKQ